MTAEIIKSHLEAIKIDPEIKKDVPLLIASIARYEAKIKKQSTIDHSERLKARKLKDYTKKV